MRSRLCCEQLTTRLKSTCLGSNSSLLLLSQVILGKLSTLSKLKSECLAQNKSFKS